MAKAIGNPMVAIVRYRVSWVRARLIDWAEIGVPRIGM